MKTSLLLLVTLAAYIVSAIPIEQDAEEDVYTRFYEVTGENGRIIDSDLELNMALLKEIERNPANNEYSLYTRRNQNLPQTLIMNNADSIIQSNFNPSVPIIVIVHDWLGSKFTIPIPNLKNAFLHKSDVNLIVMDWSRLARSDYVTAARGVPAVGRGLGQFMIFLHSITGAPYSSFHLIGFGLGVHLVGNAGREMSGQAARITALSPTGPLWTYSADRLNANDAVYVEVIHTNGGLGIGIPIGDVDFFPNGGNSQPGCDTNQCDHNRAWELFIVTLTRNIIGIQCSSLMQVTLNTCRGQRLPMGNDDLEKTGSGIFRVDTGSVYPF